MAKNEIPKISEKNTKTEILEAFNIVSERLRSAASAKIDPVAEVTEKKNNAVIEKVKGVSTDKIEDALSLLKSNLNQVTDQLSIYNEITQAIEVKKAELKEMFDIEKSAFTLAALINSQNEVREKFDKEMEEKRLATEAKLSEIVSQIEQKKSEFKAEYDKVVAETKEARKKDENEYNYEFSRKKRLAEDAFNDEITRKRKELAEEIEEARKELANEEAIVSSRERLVTSRENEIAEMQSKIEQFPGILENAIKEAEKRGNTTASQAYGFETRYLKKEHEGALALLETKLETLQNALSDEREKNSDLAAKLDDAYTRIETLASKTVDGASSAKLVSTLETALREKSVSSGK
jgi:hypothetical protein